MLYRTEALSMVEIFQQVSSEKSVTGYMNLTDGIIHVILNMVCIIVGMHGI